MTLIASEICQCGRQIACPLEFPKWINTISIVVAILGPTATGQGADKVFKETNSYGELSDSDYWSFDDVKCHYEVSLLEEITNGLWASDFQIRTSEIDVTIEKNCESCPSYEDIEDKLLVEARKWE